MANREETTSLREEVELLRKEVRTTNSKQDEMTTVLSTVQTAVFSLSDQLSAITDVLKTLGTQGASSSEQATTRATEQPVARVEQIPVNQPTTEPNKDQINQGTKPLTEELRKRLLLEQEKTRQYTLLNAMRLPPIQVGQKSGPPGFNRTNPQEIQSENASPTALMKTARTTAFPLANQQEVNVIWDEYYKNYEKEMRTQFLKNITKGPRMEFPKFDGDNPGGWIRQCEKYFQMSGAPNDYKVSLAQLYFIDRADVWLRRSGLLKKHPTWPQFCEEVLKRFFPTSSYDLTDRFNTFKQGSLSISEYTDKFESLMAELQEENPSLSEQWFIKCYVNGMRSHIKFQLRPLRPPTLTEAYWLAVDMEQSLPPRKSFLSATPGNTKPVYNAFKSVGFENKQNEAKSPTVVQKQREPGKCWRCGDNWFHGHKCKQAPVINMLTREEPLDQSDEVDSVSEEEKEEDQQVQEKCMRISAQAMDADSVNTISIIIQVGGKQAIALVDSGSNSTFMNLSFALKTSCTILKDKNRAVAVAGGGKLWSGAYIPETVFTAAKHKFSQSFRILDLPGHDVVLGCDWLAKHSPTSFDHIKRTITVCKDREQSVTIPACDTIANAIEVDEKEMNKLITKGATGFALYLINTTVEKPTKRRPAAMARQSTTVELQTTANSV